MALDRRAAIKLLLPQFSRNPAIAERFLREAKAANRVQHPSVVQIVEFGHLPNGAPYYVMEFLDGETLSSRLKAGKMQWLASLFTIRQVAAVLAAAHRQNLIHRDLKPGNIMLIPDPEVPGGERAKVLDFGIAKLLEEEPDKAQLTKTGSLLGTPHYMAPELWRHERKIDGKVDVYALGVISFEMLAGQLPFDADVPLAVGMKHLLDAPPQLAALVTNVPHEVTALVQRMLAKAATERPSMAEVSETLNRIHLEWSGSKSSSNELAPVLPPAPASTPVPRHAPVDLDATKKYPSPPRSPVAGAVVPSSNPSRPEATTQRPLPVVGASGSQSTPPVALVVTPARRSRFIVPVAGVLVVAVVVIASLLQSRNHAVEADAGHPTDGSREIQAEVIDLATSVDLAVLLDLSQKAEPPALADQPGKDNKGPSPSSTAPAKPRCVAVIPNADCVVTSKLSAAQKKSVAEALHDARIKLCPGERLRVAVSLGRVGVTSAPPTVYDDVREIFTNSLLGRLDTRSFTGDVEVRCAPR